MEVAPGSRLIDHVSRFAVVEGDLEVFSNLAFATRISEVVGLVDTVQDLSLVPLPLGNFYVRKLDPDSCGIEITESEIGEILGSKGRVSFKNPQFVLIAAHFKRWYLATVRYVRNAKELNRRRAPMRPFFSPVSLDPKLARYMLNLSRTLPGDIILDPFCGTGGILLEAALMGRKVIGSDSSLQMVMGARMNLKYYGLAGEIINASIEELSLETKVGGIVTDFPYGRSSPLTGNISDLYELALEKFSSFLDHGKRAVVMVSDPSALGEHKGFRRLSSSSFRIHRSLTRHVEVFMRQ